MVIKYEPLNRRERILKLFREAIEAENRKDLETAKKKLDEILHESLDVEPEFYFEACFRLAEIFLQEDNYRGAVKCAIRGTARAPNGNLYRLGVKRLGDILAVIKEAGKLDDLLDDPESFIRQAGEDEELRTFVRAVLNAIQGKKVDEKFSLKEMEEVISALESSR
ncbi:hypothetical protein [Thermococcus sp. AM4]|uniref:hypothetical protein n=1 Tax=Thermococcus sp. (strain AM4) TaxID=246969 RepID=UPI0001870E55|nr:hypothetical protein [Thermococcus sp. AM4]EEB74403.1 conserved hypothetical protein [Thermococcus sp. AM4]